MLAPTFERASALIDIQSFVVDASDSAFMSADVAENHLDDMRGDAEALMQGGRYRAAKVV